MTNMTGVAVDTDIEGVLRREGVFVSTTVGVSMLPMLRNRRDTIVVRPLAAGERLRVGDVPLYRAGGRYVLHRVVGVHDGWYAIRGDNCITTEHVRDEHSGGWRSSTGAHGTWCAMGLASRAGMACIGARGWPCGRYGTAGRRCAGAQDAWRVRSGGRRRNVIGPL